MRSSPDTSGWRRLDVKPSFLLPAGFSDAGSFGVHGGWAWTRGGDTLALVFGRYTRESFVYDRDTPWPYRYLRYSDCDVVVNGRRAKIVVHEMEGFVNAILWFVGDHAVIMGTSWKSSDLPVLLRALRSAIPES
jgi:hypothetical protein